VDLQYNGEPEDLIARDIYDASCQKFGYKVGEYTDPKGNTQPAQFAPYHDDNGRVIGTKVRLRGKKFCTTGDNFADRLFGKKIWGSGGKRLVITEGEIDAMAYAQATNLNWPVVSVPQGAKGAAKAIRANIEWLETFGEVVFLFDNDDPGKEAARECADILTPGKAKIGKIPTPHKDAGDMIKAGLGSDLAKVVYNAEAVRPDGVISASEVWDSVSQPLVMGTPYPWDGLNDKLFGLREREIITLTAGSGIGKSTICAELAYHLMKTIGHKVGYVALEEGVDKTALRFMAIELSKPIHLPGVQVTKEERRAAFDVTCGTDRLYLYDHFGSLDTSNLMNKLRYMVKGLGCRWLILDHLSIVISGMDLDGDERREIDKTMTMLRAFTEETNVGLILVSHLSTPEGRSHEEGGRVTLRQLRGSRAIGQLSDVVLGLERNQQADEDDDRNLITVRILKNRYAGITGEAGVLNYDHATGRITEVRDTANDNDTPWEEKDDDCPF
jgi:twinkle protein